MNVQLKTSKYQEEFEMDERLAGVLSQMAGLMAASSPILPRKEPSKVARGEGVKGFILTECRHCGALRGFCVKTPVNYTRCKNCGAKQTIGEVKPATIYCNCGSVFRYMTNAKSKMLPYYCISCNSNALLKLTDDESEYVSGTPKFEPAVKEEGV